MRTLLGIVFTPTWLQLVSFKILWGRCYRFEARAAPLPVGCISEHSGAIQDPFKLHKVLEDLIDFTYSWYRQVEIFFVIPHTLCYRVVCDIPPRLRGLTPRQLVVECGVNLPGDKNNLLVSASVHRVQQEASQKLMVVAAKRSCLEEYARLFRERLPDIKGITTGEFARFNRWQLERPGADAKRVLVCSDDGATCELSVWERDVLVESGIQPSIDNPSPLQEGVRDAYGEVQHQAEVLIERISKVLERYQSLGQPIEQVFLGNIRCNRDTLSRSITRSTNIACDISSPLTGLVFSDRCLGELEATAEACIVRDGYFDDAIGALSPRIASLADRFVGRKR